MVKDQQEYILDVRLIDVLDAVIRRDNVDLPIVRMGLFDYNAQPNKAQVGRVLNFVIDRQNTETIMSVWPVSENSTDTMIFWAFRKSEDVGALTNTADISNKYLPAVTVGLAHFLSRKRPDVPVEKRMELKNDYAELVRTAFDEDRERTSVYFTPVVNMR